MEKRLLTNLTVKKIVSVGSIYDEAGAKNKITYRPHWAAIIKYEGETEYLCRGKKHFSNENSIVVLPKGSSYEWVCTQSGCCYIIEFECDRTLDCIFSFPISSSEEMMKSYNNIGLAHRTYQSAVKIKKIQPAIDFIEQNYDKSITNDELASLTGLSTVYFRKLFTDAFEISPIAYVHMLRVRKAKEMLIGDCSSVTDIAHSLGYSSVYAFSRTFKKHTGLSPSNFIKHAIDIGEENVPGFKGDT